MQFSYVRFFTITILVFSLIGKTNGQIPNGPGGVGSTDGTSNLLLWLDATKLTGPLGLTSSWPDLSGYNHHFTGDGITGNGAILATDASVPGRRFLQFNNTSSHFFERAYTPALNPSNNFSIFVATRMETSNTNKTLISSLNHPGPSDHGYEIYFLPAAGGNECQFFVGRGNLTPSILDTNSGPSGVWTVVVSRQTPMNIRTWIHTATANPSIHNNFSPNTIRPLRIGAQSIGAPDNFYQGAIGEVILFSFYPNPVQATIVAEYLDAKYNSTFSPVPASTGIRKQIYTMDDAANGNYDFDVAGIGSNLTDTHSDSQGTGFFRMKLANVASITDESIHEYFFWGSNAGLLEPIFTDVPPNVQTRFQRVWIAQETGRTGVSDAVLAAEVGDLNISFDLTGHGHNSVTLSDLVLLIDRNGINGFTDEIEGVGIISGAVSLGGNFYGFNNVDIDNGQRFTLGSRNMLQTPLPITWGNFQVSRKNSSVLIEWETLTEINTEYFTVERSSDGKTWNAVATVGAKGNSSTLIKYEANDDAPLSGYNYYRLLQTDLDGSSTHSKTQGLFFEKTWSGVKLSPNPFSSQIKMELQGVSEQEPIEVKILTITGTVILEYHDVVESETLMISDERLKTLSPGNYLLKIVGSKNILYSRIIKK